MKNKYPIWLRLWFWWLILTLVYLALFNSLNSPTGDTAAKVGALIGLFVPLGPYSIVKSIPVLGIPLLFLAVALVKGDDVFFKDKVMKILFNLAMLLLFTMFMDFFLWGKWCSFDIWINTEIICEGARIF